MAWGLGLGERLRVRRIERTIERLCRVVVGIPASEAPTMCPDAHAAGLLLKLLERPSCDPLRSRDGLGISPLPYDLVTSVLGVTHAAMLRGWLIARCGVEADPARRLAYLLTLIRNADAGAAQAVLRLVEPLRGKDRVDALSALRVQRLGGGLEWSDRTRVAQWCVECLETSGEYERFQLLEVMSDFDREAMESFVTSESSLASESPMLLKSLETIYKHGIEIEVSRIEAIARDCESRLLGKDSVRVVGVVPEDHSREYRRDAAVYRRAILVLASRDFERYASVCWELLASEESTAGDEVFDLIARKKGVPEVWDDLAKLDVEEMLENDAAIVRGIWFHAVLARFGPSGFFYNGDHGGLWRDAIAALRGIGLTDDAELLERAGLCAGDPSEIEGRGALEAFFEEARGGDVHDEMEKYDRAYWSDRPKAGRKVALLEALIRERETIASELAKDA